ncbi:hypothetical protein J7K50_05470 [bacterium]|nr:hypothetical protein [bacterium]
MRFIAELFAKAAAFFRSPIVRRQSRSESPEQILKGILDEMAAELPRMSLSLAKMRGIIGKLNDEITKYKEEASGLKMLIQVALDSGNDEEADRGIIHLNELSELLDHARSELEHAVNNYDAAFTLRNRYKEEIDEKTRNLKFLLKARNVAEFKAAVASTISGYEIHCAKRARLKFLEEAGIEPTAQDGYEETEFEQIE